MMISKNLPTNTTSLKSDIGVLYEDKKKNSAMSVGKKFLDDLT